MRVKHKKHDQIDLSVTIVVAPLASAIEKRADIVASAVS
jgi:hypothetical protein